jgi:hypothetical protein
MGGGVALACGSQNKLSGLRAASESGQGGVRAPKRGATCAKVQNWYWRVIGRVIFRFFPVPGT